MQKLLNEQDQRSSRRVIIKEHKYDSFCHEVLLYTQMEKTLLLPVSQRDVGGVVNMH